MGVILTPCCIQSKVQDKFQGNSGPDLGGAGRENGAWQGAGDPTMLSRRKQESISAGTWCEQHKGEIYHCT